MMEALLVMIAMGVVLVAGAGSVLLVSSVQGESGERDRFGFAEFMAYSWMVGCALLSLATFLLGQVFSGGTLLTALALCCCAPLLLNVKRLTRMVAPPRLPESAWERGLMACVALQIGFFFWFATREHFGWDGLAVWEIKARAAFLNGGVPPAEFFADPTRRWCHQAYPLFLPLLESWIYSWLGECNQSWVRALFPAFYAAGVVVLASGIRRISGNRALGLAAGALPFFVPFLMHRDGGVLSGYADFPLSVYYVAGVLQLLVYERTGRRSHLRMFGVMCLALPWIKDEGAILWLWLALLGGLVASSKLGWRSWVQAWPGAATLAGWSLFKRWVQVPPNRDILPITPSTLAGHVDRLWPILRAVAREVLNLGHWSLLWVGVTVAVLLSLLRWRTRDRSGLAPCLAVVGPLAAYTGIYLFSAAPDYMVHFWTSYPRLLLQLAPAGIVAVIFEACQRGMRTREK